MLDFKPIISACFRIRKACFAKVNHMGRSIISRSNSALLNLSNSAKLEFISSRKKTFYSNSSLQSIVFNETSYYQYPLIVSHLRGSIKFKTNYGSNSIEIKAGSTDSLLGLLLIKEYTNNGSASGLTLSLDEYWVCISSSFTRVEIGSKSGYSPCYADGNSTITQEFYGLSI